VLTHGAGPLHDKIGVWLPDKPCTHDMQGIKTQALSVRLQLLCMPIVWVEDDSTGENGWQMHSYIHPFFFRYGRVDEIVHLFLLYLTVNMCTKPLPVTPLLINVEIDIM
jgi:hypothetical protein